MAILLVNGSPHRDGETKRALRIVEEALIGDGCETVWVELGTGPVRGCVCCLRCTETARCAFDDDIANDLIDAMAAADGVVMGAPTYFGSINGAFAAVLDRVFYAGSRHRRLFDGIPAAGVAVAHRAGSLSALDRLNHYFTYAGMPVVSGIYWSSLLHGADDRFGPKILTELGHRMARASAR
ncbi:MAG: flavodoxin family protein [Olegusella sp.]|nr:flavodoxin family protein [Olegusella sp.]